MDLVSVEKFQKLQRHKNASSYEEEAKTRKKTHENWDNFVKRTARPTSDQDADEGERGFEKEKKVLPKPANSRPPLKLNGKGC